jgi:hypothetical protein
MLESRINILHKSKIIFGKGDVVAILTEWEEFITYNFSKATVFDSRNILKNKSQNVRK